MNAGFKKSYSIQIRSPQTPLVVQPSACPKTRKLLEFWICGRLRFFASVLRVFAAFLRGVLGVAKLHF